MAALPPAERVNDMNAFWSFITERYPDILKALQEHLAISFSAVILGAVIAVPIGILLVYSRVSWINSVVFFVANLFQTVPSLALLAILIPLLGIGMKLSHTCAASVFVDADLEEHVRRLSIGR